MSETSETKDRDEIAKAAIEAAVWVTCSPHEWVWTQEQQVAMAKYCVRSACVIGEAISDLERIVCTKEPDDGVILLSSEGRSHYDAEAGCEVYDHKHFSPLGDALIYLHEHLSSASNGKAALAPPACGVLTEEERSTIDWVLRTSVAIHPNERSILQNLLSRSRAQQETVGVRRENEALLIRLAKTGFEVMKERANQSELGLNETFEVAATRVIAEAQAALAATKGD